MTCNGHNSEIKYLVSTEKDESWGLSVTTVGRQEVRSAENYPPEGHPQGYTFNVEEGRVLNEFQVLYITNGEGTFTHGVNRITDTITEGKMFFLFPGVWHTYKPFNHWTEYWIGFKGEMVQHLLREKFFTKQSVVFDIGMNERIVDLYLNAIEIAKEERSGYQQALSGIVMHILGLMYYRHKTRDFVNTELTDKIDKAKIIMRETIFEPLTAEDIATRIHMSYSAFRKSFKELIGTSPSRYMLELKLNEAKRLLTTTRQSIKEISYSLNFENPEYFSIFFRKRTGCTPIAYRNIGTETLK